MIEETKGSAHVARGEVRRKKRGVCKLLKVKKRGDVECSREPVENVWREGCITRKVVVIEDLSSSGVFMVATRVQERVTTATTPRVNITSMKLTTLAPETTKNVNTSIQAITLVTILKGMNATTGKALISTFVTSGNITSEVGPRPTFANKIVTTSFSPVKVVNVTQTSDMTFVNFKEGGNITQKLMLKIELSVNSSNEIFEPREQMVEEHDADSSVRAEKIILEVEEEFFDFDWTPEDVTDHYRVLQKRETKWKACGFDF